MGFLTSLGDIMKDAGTIASDAAPAFQVLGSNANNVNQNIAAYNAQREKQAQLDKIESMAQLLASGDINDVSGLQRGYFDAGLNSQAVALAPKVFADQKARSEEQLMKKYYGEKLGVDPSGYSLAAMQEEMKQQQELKDRVAEAQAKEAARVQALKDKIAVGEAIQRFKAANPIPKAQSASLLKILGEQKAATQAEIDASVIASQQQKQAQDIISARFRTLSKAYPELPGAKILEMAKSNVTYPTEVE